MHTFTRPSDEQLFVERTAMDGACPACGAAALRGYLVLSEGGWWSVVKCQECLHSVSREPAPPLGSFVPLGTTVGAGSLEAEGRR